MNRKLKIAQFGLGPIGLECLKLAASKKWAKVVGAVDIDPQKVGERLADLTGQGDLGKAKVVMTFEELKEKPDLVFHTSVSRFKEAIEQIEPMVRSGINVVSSCEELIFPSLREPRLAAKLDRICRDSGARLVGTGVNPGFVMDILPLCLTGMVREVRSIHIRRVVNASTRRQPLQRKIGSGMSPEEFESLLRVGKAGHAGLKESFALIAHSMGWTFKKITESGNAIVAKHKIRTRYFTVRRGETCGLYQRIEGTFAGTLRLSLDLKMYLDAENPHDAIEIVGDPPLNVHIKGGVAGDQATVAALVSTAPRLLRARPGLRLLTDLPLF